MDCPEEIIAQIKKLTSVIITAQDKFDKGIYKTHNEAITLQRLKRDRQKLMAKVPLKLAFSHPDPDSLPPPLKRTRNEVRALMGLPPIENEAANDA